MNGINGINVTKRDGSSQNFDLEKVHRVLEWAVEDISGVSMSEIELKANIQLYDKIKAYDIHELLIKSAAELITDHTPNYQFVAARLISYKLRKEAYGEYEPPHLAEIISKNVDLGVYDSEILLKYTKEELEEVFNKDFNEALKNAETLIDGRPINFIAKQVIIEMVFQLGIGGVSKFKKMWSALDKEDYGEASFQMTQSRWHDQTPKRCQSLAAKMRSAKI